MKHSWIVLLFLFTTGTIKAATHIFWYQCSTKNYDLSAFPGPNIQGPVIKHEGKIGSCTYKASKNSYEDSWQIGSGLDDLQGRSGILWFSDLNLMSGTCTKAVVRAEFRDGWAGNAFCNAGPIKIRIGVLDFTGNLVADSGANRIPDNFTWADKYPISESVGFKAGAPTTGFTDSMRAQEIIEFIAPTGTSSPTSVPPLEKQFVEVEITNQVNWILAHTGKDNPLAKDLSDSASYAIGFIVTRGQGSLGKVNTWSFETGSKALGNPNPWTEDGNTLHLVVSSDNLQPLATSVEKESPTRLNELSLGANFPNSFSDFTNIPYRIESAKRGVLKIYNAEGRIVFAKPVTGQGMVKWNGSNLASGIYTGELVVGHQKVSRTMILMR